jgi:hypothetical protein
MVVFIANQVSYFTFRCIFLQSKILSGDKTLKASKRTESKSAESEEIMENRNKNYHENTKRRKHEKGLKN